MSRKFRITIEVEMPDRTTAQQAKAAIEQRQLGMVTVRKVTVEDESPHPGVQAAFIYNSAGRDPCHAVVRKKSGPWSANRFGFCGVEPEAGPVSSIDEPQGGLCRTCAKFVHKEGDGKWYVNAGAPLPGSKVRATVDCEGCDDD